MPESGRRWRRSRYVAGLVCLAALAWVVTLAGWAGVGRLALGWDVRVVTSGSMTPLLEPGDLVLVDPEATASEVGQVILFDGPSGPMLHRIVEVAEEGLRTRGDAVEVADPELVTPDEVGGVARVLLPAAGWLQVNLPAPLAAGLAVAGLLVLLAGARWAFDPELDPWVRPVAPLDPFRPEPVPEPPVLPVPAMAVPASFAGPVPAAVGAVAGPATPRPRRSGPPAARKHRQARQARRPLRPATTSPTGGTVLFVARGTFA